MYNIDFRVNRQILSIPICFNDSLGKLIVRMKQLEPFKKYDDQQLEDKLIKCLKSILTKTQLEENVRQRIVGLINTKRSSHNKDIILSNNLSLLPNNRYQQSSNHKNSSHYQQNNPISQSTTKRLNRKYDINLHQIIDQSYQNSLQNQLNYKYNDNSTNINNRQLSSSSFGKQRQQQSSFNGGRKQKLSSNKKLQHIQSQYYDQIKQYESHQKNRRSNDYSKGNINNVIAADKRYSCICGKNGQAMMMKKSIDHYNNEGMKNGVIDPMMMPSYNKQTQQKQYHITNNNNKSLSQQKLTSKRNTTTERRSNNIDHLVSLTYQRPCQQYGQQLMSNNDRRQQQQLATITTTNYNPIPKLNQLIDKSRSLSQIVRKQTNVKNILQKRDLNRSTNLIKSNNVGKIQHHRPIYNDNQQLIRQTTNLRHKENYLPLSLSKPKPCTINELISHNHQNIKRPTNPPPYFNQTQLQPTTKNYTPNFAQQRNKKAYSYLS